MPFISQLVVAMRRVFAIWAAFALVMAIEGQGSNEGYIFIPRPTGNGAIYEAATEHSERCRYPPAIGSSVPSFIFAPPAGTTTLGAVILLHECMGIQQYVLTTAKTLADAGFVAAVPNIFRESVPALSPTDCRYVDKQSLSSEATECMWKMQHLDWGAAMQDVAATAKYLHATYGPPGIATWGFSMGGALSLLSASKNFPHITASIAFYGFPDNKTAPGAGRLFDPLAIKIPVLFESGSLDPFQGFSAPTMASIAKTRIVHARVTSIVQADCGHSFMNDASWWRFDVAQHANETCRHAGYSSAVSFLADNFHVNPRLANLPQVVTSCESLHLSETTSSSGAFPHNMTYKVFFVLMALSGSLLGLRFCSRAVKPRIAPGVLVQYILGHSSSDSVLTRHLVCT